MPVFRILFCQQQLMRDLNENWLILIVGMFTRWNGWRQLEVPPLADHHMPRYGSDYRLADMFFAGGLLAFILPFRRYWVGRCQHRVQLVMLAAEVMLLLLVVEYNNNVVWQPLLALYRDMFEILGYRDFWFYCYVPGMARWLADGRAYESFQLLISFAFFVAGINSVAGEWMRTVDLLLLGCEPQLPRQAWQRDHRGFQGQDQVRGAINTDTSSSSTRPTPDQLMYPRLCLACIREAAVAEQGAAAATNEPELSPDSTTSPSNDFKNL